MDTSQKKAHHSSRRSDSLSKALTSRPQMYERVGFDQRQLVFHPDGTFGLGRSDQEEFWDIVNDKTADNPQGVLEISSRSGLTCRLHYDADTERWGGFWLCGEQMPIRIYPYPTHLQNSEEQATLAVSSAPQPLEGAAVCSVPSGPEIPSQATPLGAKLRHRKPLGILSPRPGQQMFTRPYRMQVVSHEQGDFSSIVNTNVLIYWPHGFGDWVYLSYIVPLMDASNRYWAAQFGDDSSSLFESSDYVTPLYLGSSADGSSFANSHFGLRYEEIDGTEKLLELPLALADQCQQLGISTMLWSSFPEVCGYNPAPFHTKARALLPTVASPLSLSTAALERPLVNAINFEVSSWLTRWIESRLQSFVGFGHRKLCLIGRNGYSSHGKNWGHYWREDLPVEKQCEGEECRDFMRLMLKKDPLWAFLVMEDVIFSGDNTVCSEELHAYSYARIFGTIGAAAAPFGLVMKALCSFADLVVGVPAGPYHFSMAKPDLPTVGLWIEHLPNWYDEPKDASRHLISRNVREIGAHDRPGSSSLVSELSFTSRWLETRIIPGESVLESVEDLLYSNVLHFGNSANETQELNETQEPSQG